MPVTAIETTQPGIWREPKTTVRSKASFQPERIPEKFKANPVW